MLVYDDNLNAIVIFWIRTAVNISNIFAYSSSFDYITNQSKVRLIHSFVRIIIAEYLGGELWEKNY